MPKTKKSSRKPVVEVPDLTAKKNPRGGHAEISITKQVDKASPILMSSPTPSKTK